MKFHTRSSSRPSEVLSRPWCWDQHKWRFGVLMGLLATVQVIWLISMESEMHTTNNIRSSLVPFEQKEATRLLVTPRKFQRPAQDAFSLSFWNSIHDAEHAYYGAVNSTEETEKCSDFGGIGLMNKLLQSKQTVVSPSSSSGKSNNSQLDSYQAGNFQIFHATSAVLQVRSNPNQNPPKISILVQGEVQDQSIVDTRIRNVVGGKKGTPSTLEDATGKMQFVDVLPTDCDYIINHPVFLMDDDAAHWNWWFFHMEQIKMFVMYALFQPELVQKYMGPSPQLFFIAKDAVYHRPNTDGLEFLFTDKRSPHGSVQIWSEESESTGTPSTRNNTRNYCFQDRLIWSPGARKGSDAILINKIHPHMTCFSAIVTAYAAHLKASLHIPVLPTHHAILSRGVTNLTPKKPRVLWISRDTSLEMNQHPWQRQRIISNQDELTDYLKSNCEQRGIEMQVANFHDSQTSETPYQEQAHYVSRSNILIGVHGAGLNLLMFMPFNSVVVEIHLGTQVQKNSANTIAHLGGGGYISFNGKKNEKNNRLDEELVWQNLQKAVEEWERMQAK
jgi:hypothetical protein